MAQFLVPISDVATTTWATTPIFSKVDEGAPGSDDTVSNVSPVVTEWSRHLVTSGSDPGVTTGHVLRARWAKASGGGANYDYTLNLYQGTPATGTLIATLELLGHDISTLQIDTYGLSGAEAGNITDYTDLYLEFYGAKNGGGANRDMVVDFVELEIPDAASTTDAAQFSDTSTDRVVFENTPELDNMLSGSWYMWLYMGASWDADEIIAELGSSGNLGINIQHGTGSGVLQWSRLRATTHLTMAAANFDLAEWLFLAVAFDTAGADGDQHWYKGKEGTAIAEVTYGNRDVGSGTPVNNNTKSYWGNTDPAATAKSLDGSIAIEAYYPGVILTSGQFETERLNPDPTRVAGCKRFAAMQPDGVIIDYITGNIAAQTGVTQVDGPTGVTFPAPPFAAMSAMRGILDVHLT
jgi:hypothetical protein